MRDSGAYRAMAFTEVGHAARSARDSRSPADGNPAYLAPTGLDIDLEDVLPMGGLFSLFVSQVAEDAGQGYLRRFVDQRKTTEDVPAGNDNPVSDSAAYLTYSATGPIYPGPSSAVFTTTAPRLSIAQSSQFSYNVLSGTTGRPGLLSANVGGNYPIHISVAPGGSSNPAAATFAASPATLSVPGQTLAAPRVAVTVPLTATNGAIATASATITAVNAIAGQPAVQNATQATSLTITALNPTRALDAVGSPFETTLFAAVRGFGADALVLNEVAGSSLGTFIGSHLGAEAQSALGQIATILDPATNLESYATIGPLTRQRQHSLCGQHFRRSGKSDRCATPGDAHERRAILVGR